MLTAISPIDGRYAGRTKELQEYFSEFALIKYRVVVEVEYFKALCQIPLPQLKAVDESYFDKLDKIVADFGVEEAEQIKAIERVTNHDVKAVEYFLKEQFDAIGLSQVKEFIHFGLTSQDINNTANPLMIKIAMDKVYYPLLADLIDQLYSLAKEWLDIPCLLYTSPSPRDATLSRMPSSA